MKNILYFVRWWIHIIIFLLLMGLQYGLYRVWMQEQKNQESVSKVITEASLPNNALLYINEMTNSYMNANNCFDKFLSSHSETDLADYRTSLNNFSLYLDSLQQFGTNNLELNGILATKENISLKVANLRKQLDRLMNDNKSFVQKELVGISPLKPYKSIITYDTIMLSIDTAKSKKKGLFGRLGDAFTGGENQSGIKEIYLVQMKINGLELGSENTKQNQKILSQDKAFQKVRDTYNAMLKQNANLLKINEEILSGSKYILQYYTKSVNEFTNKRKMRFVEDFLKNNDYQHTNLKYVLLCCIVVTVTLLLYILLINIYERNLREARRNAEQKAQITNKILGFLSHEIRTPFNIIQSLTEKISITNQLSSEEQKMLNSVQFSSNSINYIIQQVLDFIKNGDDSLTKNESNFVLGEEISEILFSLRILADYKNLYLIDDNHITPNVIVCGDKGKLNQLFYNIVFNCIKFTNEGGVTVTSDTQTESDGKIKLIVKVDDTGIGIEKSDISHIFDEYYQGEIQKTSMNIGGIGLGLSISRDIVDLHNGTISAKSRKDKGTTFLFTLYYDPKKTEDIAKVLDNSYLGKLNGLKVVISEDDEVMRSILTLSLSKYHINYQSYDNAEASCEYLQTHKVDIIITDIELPGMSGIDLLHKIRESDNLNKNTPFIAITGDISQKETFIEQGFYNVIFKPFNISDLCETVSHAVEENTR